MNKTPGWYLPTAIVALLWNLLGCMAFFSDARLSPEDIAKMSQDQQALYNSRPTWALAATGIAVIGGAAGCLGLILRKRWAQPLLIASLLGVIVQDYGMFVLSGQGAQASPAVIGLQALVLVVALALVMLARKAIARGWIG
jgi:hypothetical protein